MEVFVGQRSSHKTAAAPEDAADGVAISKADRGDGGMGGSHAIASDLACDCITGFHDEVLAIEPVRRNKQVKPAYETAEADSQKEPHVREDAGRGSGIMHAGTAQVQVLYQ